MSEINYGTVATEWNRGGARRALAELKRQGFVVMPERATAEMIDEGLYPAHHGSIGDIYHEMVKVGQVKA